MSDDFKKEEKTQHHTEEKIQHTRQENPSLVSATFIKYFFMTVITLVILFFLAFYMLPMFDRDGESDGIIDVEINNPIDSGETGSNAEAEVEAEAEDGVEAEEGS